jgi:hypothetical protein
MAGESDEARTGNTCRSIGDRDAGGAGGATSPRCVSSEENMGRAFQAFGGWRGVSAKGGREN